MTERVQSTYELKTDTGRTLTWTGYDGEDAARRCADAMGVTIVAWRPPPIGLRVGTPHHD